MQRLIKVFERFRFIKLTAIVLALFIILTPFAPVFAQEAAPVPSTPTASPISTPSDPTAPATPTKETPTTAVPPDASVAPAPAAPTPSPSPFIETLNPINPAATSLIPSIDSNSGALNFTYPITIPSGRNKLAPDLKLSYSSQYRDPNNQFGYGWSINIPYIERIDKTGIANLYATNYYNSSLTGELNYISGSLYGSKIDNGEFLNYSLSGSGWVVYDKKGTKYTFGSAASSRQDNPLDSTKIYKWMLQEVRDTNNNYIA
ncbi:MAG TPA: SpvB/TcaC N-terminal domain-containing protein, partial [Patescibacteria group bacterium]